MNTERILLWPDRAPYMDECGNQAQPTLTIFSADSSRGAVIICPGGGYEWKNFEREGFPVARMLNSVGVSAYILDYRVAPCPHEAPLCDAKRAIRLLRSKGYEKVGIMGFSAGGNLCACAATLYDSGDLESPDEVEHFSSRPDVFIPCYAVSSLGECTHIGSRKSLLGDLCTDEALIRRYSAEENVTSDTPPAFIWHTAVDSLVPVENSLYLAQALARNGVTFELHVYPTGYHGLGLASEFAAVSGWAGACCRWLLEKGFGQ